MKPENCLRNGTLTGVATNEGAAGYPGSVLHNHSAAFAFEELRESNLANDRSGSRCGLACRVVLRLRRCMLGGPSMRRGRATSPLRWKGLKCCLQSEQLFAAQVYPAARQLLNPVLRVGKASLLSLLQLPN